MAEWLSLADLACTPRPGRRVVTRDAGERDHAWFCDQVHGWCAALTPLCVQGRKRWALYDEDPLRFAAALWGAWHAGATVILISELAPAVLAGLATDVDGFIGALPERYAPLTPAFGRGVDAPIAPLNLHACALFIYTSGSTGAPNLIRKGLHQLAAEVHALEACFGARMGCAPVQATVSHQHIYGLLYRVLWPLAAGRPIAAPRFREPKDRAQSDEPADPCVLIASPAYLKRLAPGPARQPAVCVFSSGGVLPAEAAEAAAQVYGSLPLEVYGSSETGGVAWRQGAAPWQALPNVHWRIDGELLAVRSPHLADEAWYVTEDRAAATADGDSFTLLGRADRVVKVEEKRVSLSAIEARLLASVWLTQARALVLTGARQTVAVLAVPSGQGQALLQERGKHAFNETLRGLLVDHLHPVALPRRFHYTEALPCNAQGKTPDSLLAALFSRFLPAPRWLERHVASAKLELDVTVDLAAFEGHFPELPVLPGVVLLDWAVTFAHSAFSLAGAFIRLEALKFQRVVRPDTTLALKLEHHVAKNTLTFQYTSPSGIHAAGRVVFAAPHG